MVCLRPLLCVKGSHLRLDIEGPAPSPTQEEHEKFRRQHTRFNNKPCLMGCRLHLASQQKLCNKIHMLTIISVHSEISAPRNVQKFGHIPRSCRETISVYLPEILQNEHLHILVQRAKPHVQIMSESCHERMSYNLCSCNARYQSTDC